MNPFIAEKALIQNFSKKSCLHPLQSSGQCEGDIVRAHTIQQNGGLSRIARNKHVYGVKPSMAQLFKNNGRFEPQLLGINRASTFTGFCALHDDRTFAPLEKERFEGTDEQCFLVSYRALCRELFNKRAALASSELNRETDKGRSLNMQFEIQSMVNLWKAALENSLNRLEQQKTTFDDILLRRDYSSLKRVVLFLETMPEVLCSGGFTPHYDFEGNNLQDLDLLGVKFDDVTCGIIPGDSGGAVVFIWRDEVTHASRRLMQSLLALPEESIGNGIVTLLFEHLENIFWSPEWWDHLEQDPRRFLESKIMSGTIFGRSENCLNFGKHRIAE